MEIKRIDAYQDARFSPTALLQHGCFLADGCPYEIEIISDSEAVICGKNTELYPEIIEEFRFYAPHITQFRDSRERTVKEYPPVEVLTIPLDQIQPSQFYVDEEKIAAISSFIHKSDDIIIQVLPFEGRFISLDGHTRLYYAVTRGWRTVRAVVASSDDWVYGFVEEARNRNIFTPQNMRLLPHSEYDEKWNRFCDLYFGRSQ